MADTREKVPCGIKFHRAARKQVCYVCGWHDLGASPAQFIVRSLGHERGHY